MAPLPPKSRLGAYEIVGLLGAGGMGEVYRAKDLRLGREVAVKVLPSEVASSPDRLARFEREARAVAGLNHPNIVVLHSIEEEDGIRFLTMELVEGRGLSDLIAPGGLPVSRILDLSIPLADALVAAHERGVIHRDLKPGNVMVTHDGRVKVLDFGLAKTGGDSASAHGEALTATAGSPVSSEGQVLGTAPYMAPEQIRGETTDGRSDLFALGIMLYELATGHRPFRGETSADVSASILRDTPDPLSRVRADLPPDLERIVSRCLEKNLRERAQSALDVSNDLRRLRRALERGGQTPSSDAVASVAVLPFDNRSRDEDDEYFSDGLADELLTTLAKIRGLRVSARASSFQFKGKNVPIGEIGKALHVAALLDGSVRKMGNRVRIAVQLVNVADGYHLWSEIYDRTLDDIFAVQDDIAQSVVKELRVTLLGGEADSDASGQAKAEVARASRGRGTNPEAHRLYLLARHMLDRWNRQDTVKAVAYLEQSVALDPKFAHAWADLSRTYAREASRGWVPVEQGYLRAREAAERALQLEPELAEGHVRLAWIRMSHDLDWRGAETSIGRALELAPGSALVLGGAATLAYSLGRLEEAIDLYCRAVERDPLNSANHSNLGLALHAEDRFTEAETAYRKALELAPQRSRTRSVLSLALLAQDREEEALEEATREPEEAYRLWALAILHHSTGRRAESDGMLRALAEKYADDSAYQIAEVHGARGERDAAFEWLERAHAHRDGGLAEMKASPLLRSLRRDPRWSALLRKVGFEG